MASIELHNVSVDFPIYNANARSLKKRLLQVATGGQIGANTDGKVVVRSLDNLNLRFQDGDRIGLLGHNGAGKSTLLRVLCGVYAPTSGVATITGAIGSLIDISLGTDTEATGRENIFMRGSLLGMSRADITGHLQDIIDFSELGDFIDMPLRTYSSGMNMRLAFAVSTIMRPEILLMDEWLSVGDESFKRKADQRMKEVVSSTSILIIATHSHQLALQTCNRVLWLEHGKVRMDGSPESVCAAYFGSDATMAD